MASATTAAPATSAAGVSTMNKGAIGKWHLPASFASTHFKFTVLLLAVSLGQLVCVFLVFYLYFAY